MLAKSMAVSFSTMAQPFVVLVHLFGFGEAYRNNMVAQREGARITAGMAQTAQVVNDLGQGDLNLAQSAAASKARQHSSGLASCSDNDIAVTSEEIAAQESLKDSNKWSGLYIGAATNYNYGMDSESEYWYWQLFSHHFDLTTAENGCKMTQMMWNGPTEFGGPNETKCETKGWHWGGDDNDLPMCYKFTSCDSIVVDEIPALNATLNVAWRGHALIWGAPDSALTWHPTMAETNTTVLYNFIQEYIEDVTGYYSGDKKASAWDVVNEAVKDSATGSSSIEDSLKDNDYSSNLGTKYEYIQVALKAAREADADMKIFYNDYRTLADNDKSDAVYNLLSTLIGDGYPLDGVGFQSHLHFGFIDAGDHLGVKWNMKRFADLGLDIHITELDVGCNYMSKYKSAGCLDEYSNDAYPEENSARQAAIYETVLKACLEVPACSVFEMWGFTDYTLGSLGYLFDCEGRPKEAYSSVLSLLKQEESSGCVEVAVVRYYISSAEIAGSIKLQRGDTTALDESTGLNMSTAAVDWVSSCLTSGTWTLTIASNGTAGWGTGGSFSLETRDGTLLIANSSFDSGSEMVKTFTVGSCAAQWAECSDDSVCCDETCYKKSEYYSQCRPSCPDGWECSQS